MLWQTVCQSVPRIIKQRVMDPLGGKGWDPHEETFRSNVWPLSLVAPAFLRMALDRYEENNHSEKSSTSAKQAKSLLGDQDT